jgi:hypothetical protein
MNYQEEQTPVVVDPKRRYLADLQRRGQKAILLSAVGDALLESNLTPEEIRVRVHRLFSEPA